MLHLFAKSLILLTAVVVIQATCVDFASAQAAPGDQPASALPDPKKSSDFGIHTGTILPSRMGLRETVPGWGLRYSMPTGKGVYETSVFSGIGHGIVYRSLTLDYRMDIQVETITAHFLLGFHADQYEATEPTPASSRFAGGWHYGGGVTQWLGGPIYMRFDFRHRFSPGQILEVTLGLTYRMPAGEAAQ